MTCMQCHTWLSVSNLIWSVFGYTGYTQALTGETSSIIVIIMFVFVVDVLCTL